MYQWVLSSGDAHPNIASGLIDNEFGSFILTHSKYCTLTKDNPHSLPEVKKDYQMRLR